MSACTHRLWDLADGILCCRTDEHETHEYRSSTGSDVADRHDKTSGGEH